MVTDLARPASCAPLGRWVTAATQQAEPLLMRLDPASRAKVLMALMALLLAGVALVALAWLGGRRLRRIASTRLPKTRPHEDGWYRKPLVPDESEPPAAHDPE